MDDYSGQGLADDGAGATDEDRPMMTLGDSAARAVGGSSPLVHARRRTLRSVVAVVLALLGLLGLATFSLRSTPPHPLGTSLSGRSDSSRLFDEENVFQLMPWEIAAEKASFIETQLTDEERFSLLAGQGFLHINSWVGTSMPIKRLNIPALKMQDSSSGFRPTAPGEYGTVTSWPSMLTLASSWDEEVVRQVAAGIAREFKGKGANVLLGPGVNVHRTAYGGRNWEYLSGEDPYLGARLAPAYINAVQSQGVMAVVKHFAFNEQETDRGIGNSLVDEKVKWELYYPPFEAAIRAGVGAVMCSYNRVGGTHACENSDLLQGDLKRGMHFPGFVMSDWSATHSVHAVEKGLDMEQPAAKYLSPENLASASFPAVREAARRVLASIYHLRLDQNPSCPFPCNDARKSNQRTRPHIELAARAATEGIVLLQNDGVLPLNPDRVRTLAVIGAAATAKDTQNTWGPGSPYSGGGSGHVPAPTVVTPLQGIRARAKKAGVSVITANLENVTTRVVDATEAASRRLMGALEAATRADVVVIVAATTATESADRPSLELDSGVDELISKIARLRPTIVLIEAPGPVLTPWRHETAAIACLLLGGEQTGRAWAAMLFGDAEPAGKLPISLPASASFLIKPTPGQVSYTEMLFTSYRSPTLQAAFPFGHGLSYTRFLFDEPKQIAQGCGDPLEEAACVRINITNAGNRSGREVVQAYINFQLSDEPGKVLRGFHKTSSLPPGVQEEVEFSFTHRDLSTYEVWQHGWQQRYSMEVHIGASSADVRHILYITASTAASSWRASVVLCMLLVRLHW